MKPHVLKFFQFLEDKDNKNAPLRVKLLNSDKFKFTKDELDVDRSLFLSRTNIVSLPNGLKVGGNLDLTNCTSLKSLPDGLQVSEGLYLTNCTSIESLPNGLRVSGDLSLSGCASLASLPNELYVGRHLNLRETPLAEMYSENKIRAMIKAKGGYVGKNIYI